MKILIASAYNEKSLFWHELQKKYIFNKTKSYFDYLIINNSKKKFQLDKEILVFENPNCDKFFGSIKANKEHISACNIALDYFKENQEYTHCLIVDSDAFPICDEWDVVLSKKMNEINFNVASPIRFENLDVFFHPCAVFFNRQGSLELSFEINLIKNLVGYECEESVVKVKNNKIFPLIKTNVYSPHPIISSVYFDLFYHHGCGSRNFFCRSVHINNYYNKIQIDPNLLTDLLIKKPEEYLSKILGKKHFL